MTPPPHHRPGGGFLNPWPDAEPKGLANLLRWFAERHTTRRPAPDPSPEVFPRASPQIGRTSAGDGLALTWMGHSTVLLEFPGCTILTDPVWSEYASPVPMPQLRRWVPPPLALEELPRIDLVLLSHNHYDHLDARTVRTLAGLQPEIEWCVPLGLVPLLRRWGARQIHEFDWWDGRSIGNATIAATPAQHFSARGVHDRNQTLWCGYAMRVGQWAAFFAGDTALHPEFGEIGRRLGPFDALLLPVGAYEPRWFMRSVHMNPEDAVQAFRAVGGGGVMLPIHWGTFKLTDEPMDEPPQRTRTAWRAAGLEPGRLWLLSHGETRVSATGPSRT